MAQVLEIVVKAKDEASGALSKLGGSLGGISTGIGALAGGGAILASVGAGMAAMAINAAPIQGIADAFDGIAKAAGTSGDKMLASLEKGSSGMVSQTDLMKSFNKASMLVSQDFAVKLPEAMQYLSKVSAATGQDMNYMLDSLVVGIGRMSPMILDNLGVQASLEEATARAAEMFGVEADQLTKAQQQAGLMNVVMEKLKTNTASMPEVAGSAAASFAAFQTTLTNLKDQVGVQLLPIMTPFLQSLADGAAQALPQIIAKFSEFSDKMSTTMGPALLLVEDAINRIATSFGMAGGKVSLFDIAIGALKMVLDAFVIGVQLIAIAFQGLATVVETISATITAATPYWQAFVDMLIKMGVVDALSTGFDTLMIALSGLWDVINRIPEAIGIMLGLWDQMRTILEETGWLDIVTGAVDGLSSGFGGIVSIITDLMARWNDLKATLSSPITIPDWLTPGSPTPFEIGLRGITSAMKEINGVGLNFAGAGVGGGGNMNISVAPQPVMLDGQAIGRVFSPGSAVKKIGGASPL